MANTPQTGLIQETNTYDNESMNFLRGMMKANAANLALMNPFQSGRHHFIFTKLPEFMVGMFPDHMTRFKHMIERFSTAFDGIQDMQAQYNEMAGGSSGNKFSYLTTVDDNFDEFTIRMPFDTHKLPLLETLELWITGMLDPVSNFTHYHGWLEQNPNMDPSIEHEVAEGIYILLDRAGRPLRSCMLYGIRPTKAHKGQLNSEKNSHDAQQVDLTFKGIKREGVEINRLAKEMVEKLTIAKNYLDTKIEE